MKHMKKLARIQNQETKALENYKETQDPKYLNIIYNCLDRRRQILLNKLPDSQIVKNSK